MSILGMDLHRGVDGVRAHRAINLRSARGIRHALIGHGASSFTHIDAREGKSVRFIFDMGAVGLS
jgi:hypothetical protein